MSPKQLAAAKFAFVALLVGLTVIGREQIVGLFSGAKNRVETWKLQAELAALEVPPKHQQAGVATAFSRATSAAVYRHYSAPELPAVVVEGYRSTLGADWKLVDLREVKGRGEVVAKFCKGAISLTIDAMPLGDRGAYYYLGVGWTSASSAPSYCPVPAKPLSL